MKLPELPSLEDELKVKLNNESTKEKGNFDSIKNVAKKLELPDLDDLAPSGEPSLPSNENEVQLLSLNDFDNELKNANNPILERSDENVFGDLPSLDSIDSRLPDEIVKKKKVSNEFELFEDIIPIEVKQEEFKFEDIIPIKNETITLENDDSKLTQETNKETELDSEDEFSYVGSKLNEMKPKEFTVNRLNEDNTIDEIIESDDIEDMEIEDQEDFEGIDDADDEEFEKQKDTEDEFEDQEDFEDVNENNNLDDDEDFDESEFSFLPTVDEEDQDDEEDFGGLLPGVTDDYEDDNYEEDIKANPKAKKGFKELDEDSLEKMLNNLKNKLFNRSPKKDKKQSKSEKRSPKSDKQNKDKKSSKLPTMSKSIIATVVIVAIISLGIGFGISKFSSSYKDLSELVTIVEGENTNVKIDNYSYNNGKMTFNITNLGDISADFYAIFNFKTKTLNPFSKSKFSCESDIIDVETNGKTQEIMTCDKFEEGLEYKVIIDLNESQ